MVMRNDKDVLVVRVVITAIMAFVVMMIVMFSILSCRPPPEGAAGSATRNVLHVTLQRPFRHVLCLPYFCYDLEPIRVRLLIQLCPI